VTWAAGIVSALAWPAALVVIAVIIIAASDRHDRRPPGC